MVEDKLPLLLEVMIGFEGGGDLIEVDEELGIHAPDAGLKGLPGHRRGWVGMGASSSGGAGQARDRYKRESEREPEGQGFTLPK